jgi:hypothetical protein
MTVRTALVIVGLLAPVSVSAATTGDQLSTSPSAPTLFPKAPQKDPYAKLFKEATTQTKPQPPRVEIREDPATERPKVVCGMTLIPVDDSIDPKFRLRGPASDNVRHTIRAVKPPVCSPE